MIHAHSDSKERKPVTGPDFICFGLQKAGTRWLYDQMRSRSDVWMPPIKEMNFFAGLPLKPANLKIIQSVRFRNDPFVKQYSNYENHIDDIMWYRDLFKFKGDRLSGDISPIYARANDQTIKTVCETLTETKFILLVREPVSRVWSAICMDVRKGLIDAAALTDWSFVKSVVRRKRMKSSPSTVWDNWSRHIPDDHKSFWFLDDIVGRPAEVVDEICLFIGAKPGPGKIPAGFNRKESNVKVPMSPEIKRRLIDYFSGEYERCSRTFGSHALHWRESIERS